MAPRTPPPVHDRAQRTVIATISRGGRLRIPREVLERLQLVDGEQLAFFLPEGKDVAIVASVSSVVSQPVVVQ